MEDTPLLYSVEDHIATFTINREPRRNSLNHEAIRLFLKHLDEAEKDNEVYAICITGAGDKAFCTGAELGSAMTGDGQDAFADYAGLLKKMAGYSKPVVGRIRGYCLAGGMGLMLGCDLVIASDDARFGTPEVNVGLFPMMIGALIFRNVRKKKAMEMVLLGERMDAKSALEMGLINRVVPTASLDNEVNSVLRSLTEKSPIGMRIGKEAFYAMADMPLEEALDYLSGKLMEVAGTEDAKEGITAFIEKRKPNFTGK